MTYSFGPARRLIFNSLPIQVEMSRLPPHTPLYPRGEPEGGGADGDGGGGGGEGVTPLPVSRRAVAGSARYVSPTVVGSASLSEVRPRQRNQCHG